MMSHESPEHDPAIATQAFPARLPKDLYERLRRTAFEQRVSMNVIVVAAVERILGDHDAITLLSEARP